MSGDIFAETIFKCQKKSNGKEFYVTDFWWDLNKIISKSYANLILILDLMNTYLKNDPNFI